MINKQCNDFCDYLLSLKAEAERVEKLAPSKRKKAEDELMAKTINGVMKILNDEGENDGWK